MMFDVVIRGATVVDGQGNEPFQADVAVSKGRIAEIGRVTGAAHRTINADGAHLMPGFIDIHTHYDAQATWDETFSPSIYHGVTTLVMGNCGVGFAPVRQHDHDRLIDLMEGVEEIPESVLTEGIRWGWESFTQYGKQLDAIPHSLDFMTLVPHDTLRLYVMGERAAQGLPATPEEVSQMRTLLHQALKEGAAGFSIGSTETHRTAKGHMTPSFSVSQDELIGLAQAFHGLPYRILQAVDDFAASRGQPLEEQSRFDREYGKIEAMSQAAGRPVTITWMDRVHAPKQRQWLDEAALASAAKGVDVRLSCAPRGAGVLAGFDTTMNLFVAYPSYRSIMHLPPAERAAQMRQPTFKATLLAEQPIRLSVPGSPFPPILDFVIAHFDALSMTMFPFVEVNGQVDYEPHPNTSIGALAQQQGIRPIEALYDYYSQDDGSQIIYYPIYNYVNGNLDITHDMLWHPKALLSLGDGGAHVGTICDASNPTTMLAHWTQHRHRGKKIPLSKAVEWLTYRNAQFMGLNDRGTIALGQRADLNLIDLSRLALPRPTIVRDLPAGGRRLMQKATGYLATWVHGEMVTEQGEITPQRPGRWVRSPA